MKTCPDMGISIVDHKIEPSREFETAQNDVRNVITAMVRSTRFSDSSDVKSIFFETYEEMAKELMERIKRDALERYHLTDVSIVHRVGHIPVGEYAFVVSVSARRIDDAFSACKFIVEEMNSELPVWKYEVRDREIRPE